MIDPAQLVFNPSDPKASAFAPTSRYFGLVVLTREEADGTIQAYVSRRMVPAPVTERERADAVAFATLGDAEQFWRLCDGNRALHPREIEHAGVRVRVTLPEGMPGGREE